MNQINRTLRAAAFTLSLFVAAVSGGHAATLTATSAADTGPNTLRATIGAASSGDIIIFDAGLMGETIALQSEIAFATSLQIQGLGAENLSISGQRVTRIFQITGGATSISHLTLRDGLAAGAKGGDSEFGGGGGGTARGGAVLILGGSVTLEAVSLRDKA